MPGLPTTVFVIAASYLFARSSPSLEGWLKRNRWFGPSLHRFQQTRGMPRQSKVFALMSMWAGIGASTYALTDAAATARLLLVFAGIIGTGAILFLVRTTAARQSLILSSPRTGAGRVPPRK